MILADLPDKYVSIETSISLINVSFIDTESSIIKYLVNILKFEV